MEYRRMTQEALEVCIRDALAEAQGRPSMRLFLQTTLGDFLHEMKLEELARSPNSSVVLDNLLKGSKKDEEICHQGEIIRS